MKKTLVGLTVLSMTMQPIQVLVQAQEQTAKINGSINVNGTPATSSDVTVSVKCQVSHTFSTANTGEPGQVITQEQVSSFPVFEQVYGSIYRNTTDNTLFYVPKTGADVNKSTQEVADWTKTITTATLGSDGNFTIPLENVPEQVEKLVVDVSLISKETVKPNLDYYRVIIEYTYDQTGRHVKSVTKKKIAQVRTVPNKLETGDINDAVDYTEDTLKWDLAPSEKTSASLAYTPKIYVQNDTAKAETYTVSMMDTDGKLMASESVTVNAGGRGMVPFNQMTLGVNASYTFTLKDNGDKSNYYDGKTIIMTTSKEGDETTVGYSTQNEDISKTGQTDGNCFRVLPKNEIPTQKDYQSVVQNFTVNSQNNSGMEYKLCYLGVTPSMEITYDTTMYPTPEDYKASQEYKDLMNKYYPTLLEDEAGKTLSTGTTTLQGVIKAPGEYYYQISPMSMQDGNKTTDTIGYMVTVVADEDMTTTVTEVERVYIKDGTQENEKLTPSSTVTFSWTGEESKTYQINVPALKLTVAGKAESIYNFQLKDSAGNVVDTVGIQVNADSTQGVIQFGKKLELKGEGPYHYTITQVAGTNENIIYDDSVIELNITKTGESFNAVLSKEGFTNRVTSTENKPIVTVSFEGDTIGKVSLYTATKNADGTYQATTDTGYYADVTKTTKGIFSDQVEKGKLYALVSESKQFETIIFKADDKGIPQIVAGNATADAGTGNIEIKLNKPEVEDGVKVRMLYPNKDVVTDIKINGEMMSADDKGIITLPKGTTKFKYNPVAPSMNIMNIEVNLAEIQAVEGVYLVTILDNRALCGIIYNVLDKNGSPVNGLTLLCDNNVGDTPDTVTCSEDGKYKWLTDYYLKELTILKNEALGITEDIHVDPSTIEEVEKDTVYIIHLDKEIVKPSQEETPTAILKDVTYTEDNNVATVKVTIQNTAKVDGTFRVEIPGSTEVSKEVTVKAGETQEVTFTVEKATTATINLYLKTELLETKDITIDYTQPEEPATTNSGVSVPVIKEVESGIFEVSVKVKNTGTASGEIGATIFDLASRGYELISVSKEDGTEIGPEGYTEADGTFRISGVDAKDTRVIKFRLKYTEDQLVGMSTSEAVVVKATGGNRLQASVYNAHQEFLKKPSDNTGDQGNQGGNTGNQGNQGENTGDKGNQGGNTGDKGNQDGNTGDKGNQGGTAGDQGSQGGNTGDQGSQGGNTNNQGNQGGSTGDKGNQGSNTGDKGNQGSNTNNNGEKGKVHQVDPLKPVEASKKNQVQSINKSVNPVMKTATETHNPIGIVALAMTLLGILGITTKKHKKDAVQTQ